MASGQFLTLSYIYYMYVPKLPRPSIALRPKLASTPPSTLSREKGFGTHWVLYFGSRCYAELASGCLC